MTVSLTDEEMVRVKKLELKTNLKKLEEQKLNF
jgi:hypothetical protein